MNAIATVAGLALLASPVAAQHLAFDFDVDGDPTTINNEVTAAVGDILEGYLVINEFDETGEYDELLGIQYGLDLSAGLESLGSAVLVPSAGVINEGVAAIFAAFVDHPLHRDDLPAFLMRFVVRVTDAGPQSVVVGGPVYGGNPLGIEVVLWNDEGMATIPAGTLADDQLVARINDATPTRESSWSAVKRLFSADEL